jgi:hypothetical protein
MKIYLVDSWLRDKICFEYEFENKAFFSVSLTKSNISSRIRSRIQYGFIPWIGGTWGIAWWGPQITWYCPFKLSCQILEVGRGKTRMRAERGIKSGSEMKEECSRMYSNTTHGYPTTQAPLADSSRISRYSFTFSPVLPLQVTNADSSDRCIFHCEEGTHTRT